MVKSSIYWNVCCANWYVAKFVSASMKKKKENNTKRKSSSPGSFLLLFRPFPVFSVPWRSGPQSFTKEQRSDFPSDTAGRIWRNRSLFMSTILVIFRALLQISSHPGCCSPSHLHTRTMEMQHLGSHSLYAAHNFFLMAHQRDPNTHHIPGDITTQIFGSDHSVSYSHIISISTIYMIYVYIYIYVSSNETANGSYKFVTFRMESDFISEMVFYDSFKQMGQQTI